MLWSIIQMVYKLTSQVDRPTQFHMITMADSFPGRCEGLGISDGAVHTECSNCHNSHSLVMDHPLMLMKHRSL